MVGRVEVDAANREAMGLKLRSVFIFAISLEGRSCRYAQLHQLMKGKSRSRPAQIKF